MMICRFIKGKLILEMEFLRKAASKTVFLTILVSMMMIDTTTSITDEGKIYNKNNRLVIVFSLECILGVFCWFLMSKESP